MTLLLLGLLLFIGMHLVPTMRATRAGLIGRMGEAAYKGMFTLVSALGLGLIVWGYARAPYIPVWDPPLWLRHFTYLLMLPVFPLLFAAYLPGQIKRFLPNPMLLSVKLWAVAHLLAKGTLAAMILFAAFLAWAVLDLVSVKQRQREGLVAVRTGPVVNDAIAIVLGLVVYAFMLYWGHWRLFGVPILPA
jgi:uncharacterized membrane protein